jgi:hypothetical protein
MAHDAAPHLEYKYLFPAGYEAPVLEWLEHACLSDPVYDHGIVYSIYYDTPGLFHYQESGDGDFLKSKVRLRWYADSGSPVPETAASATSVKCFLEAKKKFGSVREKRRLELFLPTETLDSDPFSQAAILDLPLRAFELGYLPSGILVPVLLVRYRRRRFVDPETHVRIAVDTEICCPAANESLLPGLPPVHLGLGVVETKGPRRGWPATLRPLQGLLTRSPFSKYARCLEELQQPLGRRV